MTLVCSIGGCFGKHIAKGYCGKHYQRWRKHGSAKPHKDYRAAGEGCIRKDGYHLVTVGLKQQRLAHHLIVERAIGKPLPKGAVVHHVDGNPSNNAPENLVVCPDQAYHVLLHKRQAALESCGHADWLRCSICKQYDSPENVKQYGKERKPMHLACNRELKRQQALGRLTK